jgi:hypothetical protein
MQYRHIVDIVVASLDVNPHYICWFSAIPSLVVPDFAPQKVLPPIQDESGDAMEDNEWAHKGSRWVCKVDHVLVFMWPNGCFVSIWNAHIPFECKPKN